MPPPEETGSPVVSPFADVHERVRQFNEDEAVWRCFTRKRARRNKLKGLASQGATLPLTEDELDRLAWLAAEREARPVRAIGIDISESQSS